MKTPPPPIPQHSLMRSADARPKPFPTPLWNRRSRGSFRERNGSIMDIERSTICIRESLDHLVELLEESCTGCERQWIGRMNQHLDRVEQALSTETAEPMASEFINETAQTHPRLISLCAKFHEDGRRLLRQAAVVVLLSVRSYETGTAPLRELRKATALLIDAVKRHQNLESELIGEAGRDIGGQG